MSTNPSALIQEKMDAFDRRWRWLTFWEYLGAAGSVFSLLALATEICAWRGILTSTGTFYLLVSTFVIGIIVAFVGIWIVVTAREQRRAWLAERLEQGSPGLLDRLNTIVYFEKLKRPYPFALKRRIEAQAAAVFVEKPAIVHFSPKRAWLLMGLFAVTLTGAIWFNHHYHPFDKLLNPVEAAAGKKNDTAFELVPSNTTEAAKVQKPWGEVRIVAPGRDVKLTKIDVLPLQIEIATSSALKNPAWITSINGGPEVRHDLAPSTEPQYAVYQPLVYLDQLNVTEWDVVSYYATVETSDPAQYASKIYFIEIRPFREDIIKETGGEKAVKTRDLLNELNGLIRRQTSEVQETHEFKQTTYPTDEMRKQDLKKLTDTQGDISGATQHFYGRIVSENENGDVGEILDHLTQAEDEMDKAKENLGEDILPDAMQREQGAMMELIACRKAFLKTISKTPNVFGDGSSSDTGEQPIATAEDSQKAMSQVTEMHNREEAALKQLDDLNQRQHSLAKYGTGDDSNNGSNGAQTAKFETNLKNQVEKLMQENPNLFRSADSEKASLQSDMDQAISHLSQNDTYRGKHYLEHAAGDMNDLEKAVQKNHQLEQMAEAYKLKKIIDQNAQQLGQEENKPGSLSPQDKQALSDSAKRSTGTLKELVDGPGHDGFGQNLSQALSPENQQSLQKSLDQLQQSQPGPESQGAASAAQSGLAKVSQAFDKDRPSMSQQGQMGQGGAGSGGDALGDAIGRLRGLVMAQQGKPDPSDQAKKEASEILADLHDELSKENTPDAAAAIAEIDKMGNQDPHSPFDPGELKKLLDQIDTMSAEAHDPNQDKPPASEITVIDASKFPPTYRDRIRAYYEQLSNHDQ